ncbi:Serine/threonine protein kinase [Lentzea fradiae]|uniref:non-specific serine/threonine protein kinase n=1 Tax=Lentzea fradiae TaxID=200378 RepID=A0A1G7NJ97_9PSEU|nr:serine/threonine-protein kinase [Lentzea fradiae]SDF74138.1 Serine/threonine protein kinase [Lentzea fradiae]
MAELINDGKAAMPAQELVLADRYELADVLGTGGMAEVRRAWDRRLHRHVAVKLFRAGAELTQERRFDNEIRTLASLSHPRLVQVHDAGISGDMQFVVLQLVDGCTLRDRIAEGPLGVEDVQRIGAELADALAYVHAMGVVHRDVKPSNVLMDHDDNTHLADFGLARVVDTTRLTRPDQVVGTAAYLAPEQVRGEDLTGAVDVYALGLVLLECLTGQREYQGSEIEAAVARLHRQPAIPDDLPVHLRRLLTAMTSLSPRRRPSAAECAAALREPGEAPTRIGAALRKQRAMAGPLVVGVFAAVGLAAVLLPSPPVESAPTTTSTPTAATPVQVTEETQQLQQQQPQEQEQQQAEEPAVVVPAAGPVAAGPVEVKPKAVEKPKAIERPKSDGPGSVHLKGPGKGKGPAGR